MEGRPFGRYRLIELLGRGGMGEVWRAQDTETDRNVAIKVLPGQFSDDEEFQRRFRREAHAAARLNDPHVIPIHNYGEIEGQLYVDMRLIEGRDLQALLAEGPLEPARAVRIVDQVAKALHAAHEVGLLHRDIKPSNILLGRDDFAYLIDFGIARAMNETRMTKSGNTIGTFAYIAPERLNPKIDEDARADIYSLACVLYEALTGQPPFPGDTMAHLIAAHLSTPPPRPSSTQPDVPAQFDEVIATGMAKDRDQRYATTIELADAARGAITVHNPRPTASPPTLRATEPAPGHTLVNDATRPAAPRQHRKSAAAPPPSTRPPREPPLSRIKIWAAAAVVLVAAVVLAVALNVKNINSPASAPGSSAAPSVAPVCGLHSMSARDKLAQLLMVGVTGAADARAVVVNQHVGGIFIGSWTDLSMLTDGSLFTIAGSAGPLPLAVSVDEEGGRVEPLSSLIGTAPSARLLAQTQSPDTVYRLALERGRKMRQLGITIDFAPVVDVTNAPDDTVIGDRSFSNDPTVVTTYAGEYARGLRDAGVLPVLKHFPGHGHASGDSRTGDVVTPPLSELQNLDLVPYRTLVAQRPVSVMIGHMQVPGLTGSDPASLSPAAITLLRRGTGYGAPPFDGPVFTDDLSSKKAITDRYSVSAAVLKALQAGADTALWITTAEVPTVLNRLESALADGELSMPNIDASLQRMAAAKNSHCGH